VGVVTLSSLLADPIAKLSLYRQGLGFLLGLLPYLQTYAAAFFALPLVRAAVDGRRNREIGGRNETRLEVRCARAHTRVARRCACVWVCAPGGGAAGHA
jgi:hypothetical protein